MFAIHNRNPVKKKMSNFNINRKLKKEKKQSRVPEIHPVPHN